MHQRGKDGSAGNDCPKPKIVQICRFYAPICPKMRPLVHSDVPEIHSSLSSIRIYGGTSKKKPVSMELSRHECFCLRNQAAYLVKGEKKKKSPFLCLLVRCSWRETTCSRNTTKNFTTKFIHCFLKCIQICLQFIPDFFQFNYNRDKA